MVRLVYVFAILLSSQFVQAADFTLSTWIRFGERSSVYSLIASYGDSLELRAYSSERVRVNFPGGGYLITHKIMGTLDSWYHLLIEVENGEGRLFVNGLPAGTTASGEIAAGEWVVRDAPEGNSWDIGDTAVWFDDAPSRNEIFESLVSGQRLKSQQYLDTKYKARLEPAVKAVSAKLNESGLLTLEFSHVADRGSGADEFSWPVAWRGRGAKICHVPTTGLQVGDTITVPSRFIEVETTGEFNGKTDIKVTAAEELTELPLPAERVPLAGNAGPGRYFSNVFRYGNDLQKLTRWTVLGSGFKEDAELDPATGIPIGDAEHHWSFTDRRNAEGYVLQWKGAGRLELSHSGSSRPTETGVTADGWRYASYPPGHDGRIRKIGEVTAMRGQWESLLADIDKGSTAEARELWAPFACIRHMGSMGTNSSTVVNPEDLVGPEFVGQRHNCNIPALCRLTNELGVEAAWFCVPHAATDACVRRMFELIRDNLAPNIAVYIEYTNEAWNYGGAYKPQTRYVRDLDKTKSINENYAKRSVEIETIGIEVLGDRYGKTILAGQFAVPSKANGRYLLAVQYGLQRGAISNAVYFSPDILDEDPATWAALKEMDGSQLMDLTKYSLEEDLVNFRQIRDFCQEHNVECLAYEGGWSYSNRKVNAGNFDFVGRVALEGARHPKQVELHHYAYTLSQQYGFTLAMHLAPEKGGWDLLPQKFKTWSDYEAWDQKPGTGTGQSPRGLAPITWSK